MRICSLICAYDEEQTIERIAGESKNYCNEVLVVDDGSRDKTAEIAKQAGAIVLTHSQNRGKGAALKTGFDYFLNHDFDTIVTLDADGQHLPCEIQSLTNIIRYGKDFVIGYRNFNAEGVPFIRRNTNKFDSWLLSKLLGKKVYDAQSGFRAFNRKAAEETYRIMNNDGFSCEPEMVIQMVKKGFDIGWVPIKTIYETGRKSKIKPFKHFVDSLRLYGKCLGR